MFSLNTYPLGINVIPNFTVPDLLLRSPSDQDNLHPLFLLASLCPIYTGSFGYYSQYPSSFPHPIIWGPIPIRC